MCTLPWVPFLGTTPNGHCILVSSLPPQKNARKLTVHVAGQLVVGLTWTQVSKNPQFGYSAPFSLCISSYMSSCGCTPGHLYVVVISVVLSVSFCLGAVPVGPNRPQNLTTVLQQAAVWVSFGPTDPTQGVLCAVPARCVYWGYSIGLPTYFAGQCMGSQAVPGMIIAPTALSLVRHQPCPFHGFFAGITVTYTRSNGDHVLAPFISLSKYVQYGGIEYDASPHGACSMGLLSLGAILEGGKSQAGPGVLAAQVECSAPAVRDKYSPY